MPPGVGKLFTLKVIRRNGSVRLTLYRAFKGKTAEYDGGLNLSARSRLGCTEAPSKAGRAANTLSLEVSTVYVRRWMCPMFLDAIDTNYEKQGTDTYSK